MIEKIKLKTNIKKILISIILILISFFIVDKIFVKADTIINYSYQFKWLLYDGSTGTDIENHWTNWHTSDDVYSLDLYGKENFSPTYDQWEYMSGFDVEVNFPITKDSNYNINLIFNFNSISSEEFKPSSLDRFINSDYVRITNSSYSSGSYSYSKNSCSSYSGTEYCDYTISINYSFTATSSASSFSIGSWVANGAGYGFFEHYLTSGYSLTYLSIISNNNDTIINQNQTIIDQNQQTNNKLDDMNDNLTSEEMPDVPDFSDIELADDQPISDLVMMPLNYLNKLINSFSNSCSPYSLDFGILGVDYTLTFPCIKVENWIGSAAWNIVDMLICFFMCYEIGMLAVMIFNDWTSMRDTYDSLYQPKHAEKGYQPKHGGGE